MKRYVVYIAITLFLFAPNKNHAQVFSKRYDVDKRVSVTAGTLFHNNYFYFAGKTADSTFYYGQFLQGKIEITKIAADGTLIFGKTYGKDSLYYEISPTSEPVAKGNSFYLHSFYRDKKNRWRPYLFKFNANGDSLLLRHYFENDTTLSFYSDMCKVTRDGNLILSGTVDSSFYNKGRSLYLMKTDTMGNIIWFKSYGFFSENYAATMDTCSNGGFILGGRTRAPNSEYDSYIVKVDSAGNKQWEKRFSNYIYGNGASLVKTLKDGNILSVYSRGLGNNPNKSKIILYKFDLNGNQLWNKEINYIFDGPGIEDLTQDDDSNIIGVIPEGYYNWIIKLTPEGDSVFLRPVYLIDKLNTDPLPDQYAYSTIILPGKRIAIGGMLIPSYNIGINNTQDIWLSVYDSTGCQLPNPPYNLTAQVSKTAQDTLVTLQWQYNNPPPPNTVFFIDRFGIPYDEQWYFKQNSFGLAYTSATTYTDTLHNVEKTKYRIYAYDTLNHLMSCYSNSVNIDLTVGIKENTELSIVNVYPNPATHTLFITHNLDIYQQVLFRLYDINGKLQLSKPLNDYNAKIQLPVQLSNGIYFYKIYEAQNPVTTGKLILNR